jgi:16S rRNA (uracil1498-N3)-methyltransferase
MQTHRLYTETLIKPGIDFYIENTKAHYIKQVLRLKKDNFITVFDGSGHEYEAVIKELYKNKILVVPSTSKFHEQKNKRQIRVGQSLIKKDKMDMLIQKVTELGIHQISPLTSKYSTVKIKESRLDNKLEHWEKIIQSACEQCGRNILPLIDAPDSAQNFISNSLEERYRLILDPNATMRIHDINPMDKHIEMMIGPEGGFSDDEIEFAAKNDFLPVSMGPRILRAETAAITALVILQTLWGDMGADFVTRKR